jgi:DNA-binding protein HU-beta
MNKSDLVNIVSEKNTITKAAALRVVDTVFDAIRESLSNGEEFVMPDFGKFVVDTRAEREGRNPQTGVSITIPEAKVVKFKVGKALKDLVQHSAEIA